MIRRLASAVLFLLLAACASNNRQNVDPQRLADVIDSTDHIVVREKAQQDSKVLFDSRDEKDIRDLEQSLIVKQTKLPHTGGNASGPALFLYEDDDLIATVINNSGVAVRASLWDTDAPIADADKWLRWFDARGMPGPRQEVEENKKKEQKAKEAWARWEAAMPDAIQGHGADAITNGGKGFDTVPLARVFETKEPDARERIRALLAWYGSGRRPWTGYPDYESVPAHMLTDYPTPQIVGAILSKPIDQAQTEGAARYFCSADFAMHRGDLMEVPDTLVMRFRVYLKTTDDRPKLKIFESVFKNRP